MAATVSSPWSRPGAWALDAEEHEAELQQQHDEHQQQKASEIADFPSLATAAATKTKKKNKGQTLSLAEFNSGKVAQPTQPEGLTHEDLLVLPTGPRQRSAEELDRSRLGGGFRNYGSGIRYGSNGSGGEENSRWGGSRVSNRDAGRESQPSRADEIDNWAAAKKPVSSVREKGGFFESHSKADESDSWVSKKTPTTVPATSQESRSRFGFGAFERKSSFDSLSRERDRDNWGKKREEIGGGGSSGERPRLVLQPRTVLVSGDGPAVEKPKGASPFGAARPREEVLAEKGKDWKEIDEKLEAVKIKEERQERFERGSSFGRRGFGNGNGNGRPVETRSWRRNDSNESNSAEGVTHQSAWKTENGHAEGKSENEDAEQKSENGHVEEN